MNKKFHNKTKQSKIAHLSSSMPLYGIRKNYVKADMLWSDLKISRTSE